MLYIHKLADLNRKIAEAESIFLIREFKQKMKLPIPAAKIEECFASCMVSKTEIANMKAALACFEPLLQKVQNLYQQRDALHEAINVARVLQSLQPIPQDLANNLEFAAAIEAWQPMFLQQVPLLLNKIPLLRSMDEKTQVNGEIAKLFQTLTRSNDFRFRSDDLVQEDSVKMINGLVESFNNGYLFHITLEEEIKKLHFSRIRDRIPAEKLAEADDIFKDIQTLQKGILNAYDINMRMIEAALIFYASVKWAHLGG